MSVYCGPVLRHPAELLPAVDLGGRVCLGGKPIERNTFATRNVSPSSRTSSMVGLPLPISRMQDGLPPVPAQALSARRVAASV